MQENMHERDTYRIYGRNGKAVSCPYCHQIRDFWLDADECPICGNTLPTWMLGILHKENKRRRKTAKKPAEAEVLA